MARSRKSGNEKQFLTGVQTRDYRPALVMRPRWYDMGMPQFSIYTVEMMRLDPRVCLAMGIKMSPLLRVTFTVSGAQPIRDFILKQLQVFWRKHAYKVWSALWYTCSFNEVIYGIRNEQIVMTDLKPIYPFDGRLLTSKGQKYGIRVKSGSHVRYSGGDVDLLGPKGFAFLNNRENGAWWGRSDLEPAYRPWWEKTQKDGALDIRLMWFYANAYDKGEIYHPPGSARDETGQMRSNADYARQMLEWAKAGAAFTFPSEFDDKGNRMWERTRAQANPGSGELLAYIADLDAEITRGIGIPDDIVTAAGVGGYAGRNVPIQAFFISLGLKVDQLVAEFDQQVLRPLSWVNFGSDNYEILDAKIDLKSFYDMQEDMMNPGGDGEEPPIQLEPGAKDGDGDGIAGEGEAEEEQQEERRPAKFSSQAGFGSCVMLPVPSHIASSVLELQRRIDPDDLIESEPWPHITLLHGIADSESESVRRLLSGTNPVVCCLGQTDSFNGSEKDVLYVAVKDSPKLHELHGRCKALVENVQTHPEYHPHVTVAYLKPGTAFKYRQIAALDSMCFSADMAVLSDDDHNQTEISLREDKPIAPRAAMSSGHAPKGGIAIKGRKFKGGEFIPGSVMKTATAEQRRLIMGSKSSSSGGKVQKSTARITRQEPNEKAARAMKFAKRVDADIQRYAEEHNEPQFARAIGGVSFPNGEPVDVAIPIDVNQRREWLDESKRYSDEMKEWKNGGRRGVRPKPMKLSGPALHGIELKTMVDNSNNKITMKGDAIARKRKWERQNKAVCHTVVIDDHAVFNANGPGQHDKTKRKIYYRRGYGSFRVNGMYLVTGGMAELKKLLDTPKKKLPGGAY